MRDRHVMVERGERPAQGSEVSPWTTSAAGRASARIAPTAAMTLLKNVVERLALAHEREVVIGADPEQFQHRPDDVAMLPGRDDDGRHIAGVQLGRMTGASLMASGRVPKKHADRAPWVTSGRSMTGPAGLSARPRSRSAGTVRSRIFTSSQIDQPSM